MKKKILVILSLALCLLMGISLVSCNKNKHKAKSKWSFDETAHWHECATKKHNDKLDKANHVWNDGLITIDPTETAEGEIIFTCTVCGYTKTQSVPVISPKNNNVTVGTIDFTYNAKSQPIDSLVEAGNKAGMVIKYIGVEGTIYEESTTAPTNAGTYQYTITIPATTGWKKAEKSGIFTIEKYELTEVYEKRTKVYDGKDTILFRFYTLEDNTSVNIAVIMDSANVGAKVSEVFLPGLLRTDNYTVDKDKVQAEIVAKKLANLKFEIAEDDVKAELSEQTITREIAGANNEKVIVEITFNPGELIEEEGLELSFDGKGGATCIIKFQTENPNYELDLTLGELKLVKGATA